MNTKVTNSKKTNLKPGSFQYIEKKIHDESKGTSFGKDFEKLCKYYLQNAPEYRSLFKHVWLWEEWPGRRGRDKGIDLVAEKKEGKLWAIQAKAYNPESSIPKSEVDSFLSESNRRDFAYRLIIATTNDIGKNAVETINAQEKQVGIVRRSDLLKARIKWPIRIGGRVTKLKPVLPYKHQEEAVGKIIKGFKICKRGQLIMACGSGKTLTAFWVHKKLNSKLTLVLLPSLALVGQILKEWRTNQQFDYLLVCSDKTVVKKLDEAIQSTNDLGIPVTTDPKIIEKFIKNKRHGSVIFGTYQSADCIVKAQKKSNILFDLAIADEAHHCTGNASSEFAAVLDDSKIKAKKRLFMTATPRILTDRVKKKAEELEFEVTSMEDDAKGPFGPVFYELPFSKAIKLGLLTDYQVSIVEVTSNQLKQNIEQAKLVKRNGMITDARTLATQVALSKSIKKYNLRRIITFHSRISRARDFADPKKIGSFPFVLNMLSKSVKPSPMPWTEYISGEMPVGKRSTILDKLRYLEKKSRGIVSNCACLGEGVDVPALDGIAFFDPKRSTTDIIQAVGRVLRNAEDKKIGTVVVPVFIDEKENPDKVLSGSAFEHVWRILKALKAHDDILSDELDELRTKLGKYPKYSRKIQMPKKIKFDIPERLLKDFEKKLYVQTIKMTTNWWDSMFTLMKKNKKYSEREGYLKPSANSKKRGN